MQGLNIQARLEQLKASMLQYGDFIARENADNRNDEAKRAETYYQGVLSRLFGRTLSNLNYATSADGQKNSFTAGIDLYDEQSGNAVQITSIQDDRSRKVHETLTKTAERKTQGMPFYVNITQLMVLFITYDKKTPTVGDAYRQLAAEADISLTVATISELLDYFADRYPNNQQTFYALESAIAFAASFHHPCDGPPPIHNEEHHKKLARGHEFQDGVNHLTLSDAFHLRAIEHYSVFKAPQIGFSGNPYQGFIPHGYVGEIGAEALLSQNYLVRFWGVDKTFLDNVSTFLSNLPTANRTITPLYCVIPEMELIEAEIHTLCNRIMRLRNQMDGSWPPPVYGASPTVSVGHRPCSLATYESQMRSENQLYGFMVQHSDWFINKTDENALHIAYSSGLDQQIQHWRQCAREMDALIETLSSRIDDHRDLLDYLSGRSQAQGFGMGW